MLVIWLWLIAALCRQACDQDIFAKFKAKINQLKNEFAEAGLSFGKWDLLERLGEAEEHALDVGTVTKSFATVGITLAGRSEMIALADRVVAKRQCVAAEEAKDLEAELEQADLVCLQHTRAELAKVGRRRRIAAEAKRRRETSGRVRIPVGRVINTGEVLAAEARKQAEETAAKNARIREHGEKVAMVEETLRTARPQLEEAAEELSAATMDWEAAVAEKKRRVGPGSALYKSRSAEAKEAREQTTAMVTETKAAKVAAASKKRKLAEVVTKGESDLKKLQKQDPSQSPTKRRTKKRKTHDDNDISLDVQFDVGGTPAGQTVSSIFRQDQDARREVLTQVYGHRWRMLTEKAYFKKLDEGTARGLQFVVDQLAGRLQNHTERNVPEEVRRSDIWGAIAEFTRENLPHAVAQLQQQGFLVDVTNGDLLKVRVRCCAAGNHFLKLIC